QSESPFYHMPLMLDYHRAMQAAGFAERRSLLFPQPVYPGGSITGTLARKTGSLDQVRPLAAGVTTRYYRTELHRGLLAMPPFMQEALSGI
ncbi:MAG: polyamine aminopropyltransferase, partial [Guyparkeria sp.]